jgi:hypothetical protein
MSFLCGVGEQFSVTDLYRNAISFNGHNFLRTAFKIRLEGRRVPAYYCRCGEMSVRDDTSGNFIRLTSGDASREIGLCRITEKARADSARAFAIIISTRPS